MPDTPLYLRPRSSAPVTGRYVAVTRAGHRLGIEVWVPSGWTLPDRHVAGPGVEVRWVLAEIGGHLRAA